MTERQADITRKNSRQKHWGVDRWRGIQKSIGKEKDMEMDRWTDGQMDSSTHTDR
jgi:hypothetical protein